MILVDESSKGLAPIIVEGIAAAIKSVKTQGPRVFLVEQNVLMTLKLADRHYVIDSGNIVFLGANYRTYRTRLWLSLHRETDFYNSIKINAECHERKPVGIYCYSRGTLSNGSL